VDDRTVFGVAPKVSPNLPQLNSFLCSFAKLRKATV
jgi:hypothetical protein